jgi:outer membrane biogenesis lipoprotein LolB
MARRLTFLILLAALLASGCGSSTSSPNAKLVAQADPICRQINDRVAAVNKSLGPVRNLRGAQTLHQIAQVGIGLATFEHQAVAQLSALKAPSSLSKDWQTLLSGMQQLANYTAQLAIEAKAKNATLGEETVAKSRTLQSQLVAVATNAGFQYCGRLR